MSRSVMRILNCCMLMVRPFSLGVYYEMCFLFAQGEADVNCVCLALVTGQLAKEITEVGKEIERLFGVIDEEMLELQ